MTSLETYDAIVVGAGQAGTPLASELAGAGRRTALIERVHVGGTCVNEGCTPTKTMVASAREAAMARRAARYGVHTGEVSVDMRRVRERKQAVVDSFRDGNERRLAEANVDVVRGTASFTDPRVLSVTIRDGPTRMLTAPLVFINTGLRSTRPPLSGLDGIPVLDSTSIMELEIVPEHLIVLGGGYVGVEFAQMFRRFGSRVTLLQQSAQLLAREDPEIARAVAGILEEDGVDVCFGVQAIRVEQATPTEIVFTYHVGTGAGETSVTGSHLLVATGRRPNTDDLGLPNAGVETDERGYIRVNDRLETTAPGVYALGDVKGGPAFTHISYDDFRIIRTNLLRGGTASVAGRQVPYTVFIDPQLGRIGMTEDEARRAARTIRVATMPMSYVARAIESDETRGLMKVIVDAESRQILGAAVLGMEGGEIAAFFQIAMMGKLPYTALRDAVFPHPNLSEALNTLFAGLDSQSSGIGTR